MANYKNMLYKQAPKLPMMCYIHHAAETEAI